MASEITFGLISAGAALCGSFLGAGGSVWIERMRQKQDDVIRLQKAGDAIRIKRRDLIEQSVLEILYCAEPHIELEHHDRVHRILPEIHRMQLLLDQSKPSHRALNGAINRIGLAVEGRANEMEILSAHAALADQAKAVLGELDSEPFARVVKA